MIILDQIALQRGVKTLFKNSSMRIHPGQRLGLVGRNGAGKSSLLQLLSKELSVDAGNLDIPSSWRISRMTQELEDYAGSALDFVLDGDEKWRQLDSKIASGEHDGLALAELFHEYEAMDGYRKRALAEILLSGLGFQSSDTGRCVNDFSGGWRIRLNLARTLMTPADLLLLDEPTNHLDLDATLWLEQYLAKLPCTQILVSHDRDFLDNLVTHIISLENEALTLCKGNYTDFEQWRRQQLAQQQQLHEQQSRTIAAMTAFVERFRAKASKAKQAQSRLKALEKLVEIAPAHVDSPFRFKIPCHEKTSHPLLQLVDADLGYQTALLNQVNLRVEADSRIGILGINGAGKSTLIRTLAGQLPLLSGQRVTGEHLKIGYYHQQQRDQLDLNASPALHLQRLKPTASEQAIRNFLGSFDFCGDRAFECIEHFSGGEKARLALAMIAWQAPNLLILDEPSNHLDLEMCEALTIALQHYEGAVIIISHDRHLLKNTVDEWLLVHDGRVEEYAHDLEQYKIDALQHLKARTQSGDGKKTPEKSNNRQGKKEKQRSGGDRKPQLQPLKKQLQHCEKRMDELRQSLKAIDAQLTDQSLYDMSQAEKLNQLNNQRQQHQEALDGAEEEWLELSEQLESLE